MGRLRLAEQELPQEHDPRPEDFVTEDGSFDRRFRWIGPGVIEFVPGAYFWFAHGHHPELDAIFVDRVVLIDAE